MRLPLTDAQYLELPFFPVPPHATDTLLCPNCANTGTLIVTYNTQYVQKVAGVVGTRKHRLAIHEIGEHENWEQPSVVCETCDTRWRFDSGSNTHVTDGDDLATQIAQSNNGRGPERCSCSDERLAEQGITFQSLVDSKRDAAFPCLRGWFYSDGRIAKLCPVCDNDLLEKFSNRLQAGYRAADVLMGDGGVTTTTAPAIGTLSANATRR